MEMADKEAADIFGGLKIPGMGEVYGDQSIQDRQTLSKDWIAFLLFGRAVCNKFFEAALQVARRENSDVRDPLPWAKSQAGPSTRAPPSIYPPTADDFKGDWSETQKLSSAEEEVEVDPKEGKGKGKGKRKEKERKRKRKIDPEDTKGEGKRKRKERRWSPEL